VQAYNDNTMRDHIRKLPLRDDAPGALFGCFSLAKELGMTPSVAQRLSGHRDVYRVPANALRDWILNCKLSDVAAAIRKLMAGAASSPQTGIPDKDDGDGVKSDDQHTPTKDNVTGGEGDGGGGGNGKNDGKDGEPSDKQGTDSSKDDSQHGQSREGESSERQEDGEPSEGAGKKSDDDDSDLTPVQKAMKLLEEMDREVKEQKAKAQKAEAEAEQAKEQAQKQQQQQAQAKLPRGTSKHKDLDAVFATVKSGVPTWIAGEPGSGKTYLATQLAEALNVPLVKVAGRPDMLEADLFGSERPSTGGTWPFRPRPMLLAFAGHGEFADGALVFIDEMDNISPAGAVAAHAFFDGSEAIYAGTDDDDKPIKWERQSKLYVLAAGNTFTGTDPDGRFQRERQDVATMSRFQMGRFWIDYDQRLERKIGHSDVVEFAHKVRKIGQQNRRRSLNMSTRDIVNASTLLANGLDMDRVKESFLLGLESNEAETLAAEGLVTRVQVKAAQAASAY